jgi:DNA (cytosine-5)-methyltransferase 1
MATPAYSPASLSVVDLFSGAGGISEGFRQAGFRVVCGTDHDPDAVATYGHNFPEAEAICGDIRDHEIKRRVLDLATRCDVVAGGPPCQAFSQIRNHVRIIDDPRNSLYKEFVHVVGIVSPVAFVMENVPGIDEMGARAQIEDDLSIGGRYEVRSQVLDAADYGVPQTRRRIVFVGFRGGSGCSLSGFGGTGATERIDLVRTQIGSRGRYEIAETPTLVGTVGLAVLSDPEDLRVVTVEQAIGDLRGLKVGNREDAIAYADLPKLGSAYQRLMRERASDTLTNVQVPRINRDTELRLAEIPQGGNYRDLPEDKQARYLTGERWGPFTESGRLERKHFYAYRRLHGSMWAWTLNTKGDSAYHYEACRALSVREFARLQSFPDRFAFTTDERKGALPGRIDGGAAHSRYRQVGNAVPPLMARHVAELVRTEVERAADVRKRA